MILRAANRPKGKDNAADKSPMLLQSRFWHCYPSVYFSEMFKV
jgi:hypothetical protein